MKSVVVDGVLTNEIVLPIPQDDGKANVIPTFIKTRPLVVGGNSRGDMDMLNQSCGLKIVVNPDDKTVRGPEDGPMHGLTVKGTGKKKEPLLFGAMMYEIRKCVSILQSGESEKM